MYLTYIMRNDLGDVIFMRFIHKKELIHIVSKNRVGSLDNFIIIIYYIFSDPLYLRLFQINLKVTVISLIIMGNSLIKRVKANNDSFKT